MEMMELIEGSFAELVRNLIRGNMKKARSRASRLLEESGSERNVASRNMIERCAQAQAIRNSVVNSPSVVPGIGTLISLGLTGAESFLSLDSHVELILGLCILNDVPFENEKLLDDYVIHVIAEAYEVLDNPATVDSRAISKSYMTGLLPKKYLSRGVSKGIDRYMYKRLGPGQKSRLLPAGIGVISAAFTGYDLTLKVGKIAMNRMNSFGEAEPPAEDR